MWAWLVHVHCTATMVDTTMSSEFWEHGCPVGGSHGGLQLSSLLPLLELDRFAITTVSWVSAHAWALTWDQNTIHLHRSSYTDPLKCSVWVLTRKWALARDTMVTPFHQSKCAILLLLLYILLQYYEV